jgi:murein DD-endopeptidase MepM/ murein hydrolase activator NlpD
MKHAPGRRKPMSMVARGIFSLLWLFAASSCQSPAPDPNSVVIDTPAPAATDLPDTASPTSPSPTQLLSDEETLLTQENQAYLQIPTPVEDPLQFVFPTPKPAPVSAWRPPLYPTPWAPTPQDHFYFARPIAADEVNWPLADYRYGGVFLPDVVHTGIDIPAEIGVPVLAAGSGRVVWAGYGLFTGSEDLADPYGLAVAIRHDFGYQQEYLFTVYGHLSRVDVARGQQVQAGEVIGLTGETGKVTGPHLHFEVRVGRNTFSGSRNPELWLAPPQGWGILAGRVLGTSGAELVSQAVTIRSKETGQDWIVNSYGEGAVNKDPYYRENLVIGDLPAGEYTILMPFAGALVNFDITINPGRVTFFKFQGRKGFTTELPPTPGADFIPPDVAVSPSP